MTLSEQIANCDVCKQYAKMIDPVNHDDLFQEGWMLVWEFENKKPKKAKEVRNHKRYFYSVLKHKFYKDFKSKVRHVDVDVIDESQIIELSQDNLPPLAYMIEWMTERPDNQIALFYKNIFTLAIVCKNARDAAKYCGMSKSLFYLHYKKAKQQLKDDYLSTANPDHIHGGSLV